MMPEQTRGCKLDQLDNFDILEELALNLRSSWYHGADKVWKQLDPDLWELTHNPWVVIQAVSRERLEKTLADPNFCKIIHDLVKVNRTEAASSDWFQQKYPQPPLNHIAYFSMEYMLSEALPIYSGGLGNVAGDQLKAASDLGIPITAIGLLYQQGYFRQVINNKGTQQALYPYNDPGQLPIIPLRKENGEWLRIEVKFPGYSLWIRTWQVQVGRVKLYLLDSNDPANMPPHRAITSELYGGGPELRLRQEMFLGIGGMRLLEALGIKPDVCHLNEGHAAFAVLERAHIYMKELGQSFEDALEVTRAGNVFTTHTAVPAGFDRFSPALIEQYLGNYARTLLGISTEDLLALGRLNPKDPAEDFNMAYLAIRGSGAVNGVSRLHGEVSRNIFAPLFPHWPIDEVPIGYVTNGVHMPSWDSESSDGIWTTSCGKSRWLEPTENLEESIRKISDETFWHMRFTGRKTLIDYTRKRLALQLAVSGAPADEIKRTQHLFDPNTLTLGFARRFATYKRPNMLLHDPARLSRILTNSQCPVQLIIAGKAHPKDIPGQAMIQQWNDFINSNHMHAHVVFLSDYDIYMSEQLVRGVDVWINTPRRPWEACGTSGMKVLVNGGLNLSELDGWWAEAYSPAVGWALGDGKEHGEDPSWDASEAATLYDILEQEVIPSFYKRDAEGIPTEWVARIRESMATLTPHFSSNRCVREYTENYYLPAATRYQQRAADKGALGSQIVAWRNTLDVCWPALRFSDSKVDTKDNTHIFEVRVYLNGIDPNLVKVELYSIGDPPHPMTLLRHLPGDDKTSVYQASLPASRPASDYTPRVIPHFLDVPVPLESNHVLWQR